MDKTIVTVAKRECSDVVPLYYPMAKAAAVQITPETMYDGMVAAWSGGNIGEISNNITKIWARTEPDEDAIKILCLETNFTIDYAKTLYKTTRPPEWHERIKALTKGKVPRFFLYAKDKTVEQVEPPSQSVIDRLLDKVQSYKFDFQKRQLGFFDYRMLMHDPSLEIGEQEQKLIDTYYQMASNLGNYNLSKMDEDNVYAEALNNISGTLKAFGDRRYVTDVLVKQLFDIRHSVHKAVFWDIYGDVVYQNLLANQAGERKMCQRCGKRFTPLHNRQCLCGDCAAEVTSVPEKPRVVICVDCGKEFVPSDLKQTRCPVCQWVRDNPVQTSRVGTCIACGAPFDLPARRGRRQVMCNRCREASRRLQYQNAKRRKSGKKRKKL